MKTRIPQAIALITGIMLWAGTAQAQLIEIIAGSPTTCPGQTQVVVPLTTNYFNGVAAVSLTMVFDTSVMTYNSYTNAHPSFTGIFLVNNPALPGNTIKIGWFGLVPLNLGSAKLIDLEFTYKGGIGNLTWSTAPGDNKIDDVNGEIPTVFIPGIVQPTPDPVITSSPIDVLTDEYLNVSFSASANFASNFQWQVSSNGGVSHQDIIDGGHYSGATTSTLQITNVPYAYNGNIYRCIALNQCGTTAASAAATLTVIEVCIPPVAFNVTGGGTYCAGGLGVEIGLDSSESGINYSLLLNGIPTGVSLPGSGNAISFGFLTAAGTYTVRGEKSCDSTMMTGSSIIAINPLPLAFNISGGGSYCSGGIGFDIGLDGSETGILYVLMRDGTSTGDTLIGTSSSLSYGLQNQAGTYSIQAISPANCISQMTGNVDITVLPLPVVHTVSGGGGYCAGTGGVDIHLSGSEIGINYELILDGTTLLTSLSGTGSNLTFPGIQTAGVYTITAENASTGCTMLMANAVSVNIYPLPLVAFPAIGPFCLNDAPLVLNLATPAGGVYSGNGINSGNIFDPAQAGVGVHKITYTLTDSNGCVNYASQSIGVLDVPTIFNVQGGGTYCPTIPGPIVTLDSSELLATYELYLDGVLTMSLPGTGNPLSFGPQGNAGVYTIKASFAGQLPVCSQWMNGSAVVVVLPLNPPTATTNIISSVTTSSADLEGSVDVGCGNPITQRGFVVSTNPMPTLANMVITDILAGSGTFTLNITGLAEGMTYYVRAYAINTEGTTYGNELNFTTLITPLFLTLGLEESSDKAIWNGINGTLASGFDLTLDPNVVYHYLNFSQGNTSTNITLAQPGYFGFNVTSYPAGFFAYWDGRGVNATSAPGTWQAVMWQIINGNLPTFLVKVNTDGSLMLVDGLMHALGQPDDYLRVDWNYLLGDYSYTGTITGANGVVSAPISVDITFNGMLPEFSNLSLVNSIDKVIWSPVSGSLNLGFSVLLDSTINYYYINLENPQSQVNLPLLPGYHPFFVSSYPANFFNYWDSRGVNAASVPGTWQEVMWQIINGNLPICYIKPLPNGELMLVDGLLHLLGQPDEYLRINGTYLPGDYSFTGNITGINNLVSAPIVINVNLTRACIPVVIITQPVNKTVCLGSNTTLSTIASGSSPITYQWKLDGIDIQGANSSTLIINAASQADEGTYTCYVSNDCGDTTSNAVTLTVDLLPLIITQPQVAYVDQGYPATFSIQAAHATAYQWQLSTDGGNTWNNINNGLLYTGVSTPTLNVLNADITMNGFQFRCVATGICNPAAISEAKLLIVSLPASAITTIAPTLTALPGDTVIVPISVQNFNGVSAIALTLVYDPFVVTFLDYRNPNPQLLGAPIFVNALNGQIHMQWFSIIPINIGTTNLIDFAFIHNGGNTTLTWKLHPKEASQYGDLNGVNMTAYWVHGSINQAGNMSITSQPTNQIVCEGSPAAFNITAVGVATYLWQVSDDGGSTWTDLINSATYGGVFTAQLSISGVTSAMHNNVYRCLLNDGVSQILSNPAILYVTPWAYLNLSIKADPGLTVCTGAPIEFSLPGDSNLTAPIYTWYLNGNVVSNASTYLLVNPSDGDLVSVSVVAMAQCAATNISAVQVIVDPIPQIISQTSSVIGYEQDTVDFEVITSSNVFYHWQVSTNNGASWTNLNNIAPYAGTDASVMTINGLTLSMHNNLFRCILIEKQCGQMVISSNIPLTVKQLPVYTHIGSLTACAGDLVAVPITAENFVSIASASLRFFYDTTVLSFVGFQNIDPGFNNGILLINQFNNQISVSFFGMPPVNIGNGLLFEVLFTYKGGSTNMQWDPTFGYTMYTNVNGQTLEAYFTDGSISSKPLPDAHVLTGGGQYCAGGIGVAVGMDGSDIGINYELFLDGNPTGQILAGTGNVLDFGNQTLAGVYTVLATNATTGCVNFMTGSAQIVILPLPLVSLNLIIDEACANDAPVNLNGGTPTGGTFSGPGVNGNVFDPGIGAGDYVITYTFSDSNSCISFATDTFTVHPNPVLIISPASASICFGDSVVLTASGGDTYLWSTNETSASISVSPNATTTYMVTATTTFGCQATANVVVTVNSLPMITIVPPAPVICNGDTVVLIAQGASTYVWSTGVTGASLTVAPGSTTAYSVTGTNSLGCSAEANVVVTVNPLPSIIVSPSTTRICLGQTADLLASGAASYIWDNGATTASITVSPIITTSYSVTGTDSNACVSVGTALVIVDPLPNVYTVTGGGAYCAVGAGVAVGLNLSDLGVDYSLYLNGVPTGIMLAGTGMPLDFGNQMLAGTYEVEATDTTTGCSIMMAGNAVVTIDALPLIIQQPVDLTANIGQTVIFNVIISPAASYQWQLSTDGGITWADLNNVGVYNGTTTPNLSVGPVPFSFNGHLFRIIAQNGNCSVQSNVAMLTVNTVIPSITSTIAQHAACPGDTVIVPIMLTEANFLTAFELYLDFDPTVVQLVGYQNLHPSLAGGVLSPIPGIGSLQASWSSVIPAFLGNGALVELIFIYNQGTTSISWGANSYYLNGFGDTIPSSFTNGGIMPASAPPMVTSHPLDQTIFIGTNAHFDVAGIGISAYQWQVSTDGGVTWNDVVIGTNYSGAGMASLQVLSAPLSFHGNLYRCIISEGICGLSSISDHALLQVFPTGLQVITSLPTLNACPGSTILVPVTVQNFYQVASASLKIGYDTNALVYTGYHQAHPQLASGTLMLNQLSGELGIGWFTVYPAWITNDTLLVLEFLYNGGNTGLNFNTITYGACQYTDLNGIILPAVFNHGAVNQASYPPIVTTPPSDAYVLVGSNPSFNVVGTGISSIQWQISTDGGISWLDLQNNIFYSGVNTATLNITNAQLSMDGHYFRAILREAICNLTTTTPAALLNVVPFNPVIITHAPTLVICPDTVVVPVHVQNIAGVYSISLKLGYDISNLHYLNYQNLHPQLNQGFITVFPQGGQLGISWFSLTPASILNGTLVELVFEFTGGFSPLTWDTIVSGNCMYTDFNGIPFPDSYVSGSITSFGPILISHPMDTTVDAGTTATFHANASNVTGYQWQISVDNGLNWTDLSNTSTYSGVNTSTLSVNSVTLAMSGHIFRAILSGICPSITTHGAVMTVIPPMALITTTVGTSTSCAGSIHIPIRVTNFINVASFNLALWYNTDSLVLNYLGYTQANAVLTAGGLLNVTSSGDSVIYISWNATSGGITFGNDSLLVLQFTSVGGNTNLRWNTDFVGLCNYVDPLGYSFPQFYQNGSIIVHELPATPQMPTGTTSVCQGGGAGQYSIPPAAYTSSYLWTLSPANAGIVMGSGTTASVAWNTGFVGTASLSVLGVNSCGNGPSSPALSITVNAAPGQATTPTGPLSLCINSPNSTYTTTGATHATSYIWEISPASAGSITGTGTSAVVDWNNTFSGFAVITVQGINSCGSGLFSNGILVSVYPNPVVNLGPDVLVCASQSVTINAGITGVSYLWSTGATSQWITVDTLGYGIGTHTFSVTVTNSQGCSGSDAIQVTFDPCVGGNDLVQNLSLNVFPNPNKGQFVVEINGILKDNAELSVMNLLGEVVYRNNQVATDNNQSIQIELGRVPAGVYFLRLQQADQMLIHKIIVQH